MAQPRDTGRTRAIPIQSRRHLLAGATAALVAGAAIAAAQGAEPPVLAPEPDAELIRLGALFEVAWDAEMEAWHDYEEITAAEENTPNGNRIRAEAERTGEHTAALVDQIEAIPATTLQGLLVKRRALAWCVSGDRFTLEHLGGYGPVTTDMQLIVGMLDDMTDIGARMLA